jgi:hypothetical protein
MRKLFLTAILLFPAATYASSMCSKAVEATSWDIFVKYLNGAFALFFYVWPILLVIFLALWFFKKRNNKLLLLLLFMFLFYFHWSYQGGYFIDYSTCTYSKGEFQEMLSRKGLPATTTVVSYITPTLPPARSTPVLLKTP